MRCHLQISSYRIDLTSFNGPIYPKQCYYEMDCSFYSFYWLRFWLTVDHRTNDSSSVCGICEAYYISTRCESLYPKCNRISSNKSMNMTPYSPIPRRQRHFVDCQRTRMTQLTKDFAMRHDENYVEWNGISIKWYQFVTNCPYHQTIFQE